MIYSKELAEKHQKDKPDCEGWWIHEKYLQYRFVFVHQDGLNSKLANSGGRWYLWREMGK